MAGSNDQMNSDALMADFMKSIQGGNTIDMPSKKSTTPAAVMNPQNAIGAPNEEKLLADIQKSITDMQERMQSAYQQLQDRVLTGYSKDKRVEADLTATYDFKDLRFGTEALEGGIDQFKERVKEALKDATQGVQKITQEQTMELLQNMQIPEDIRNMGGDKE